MAALVIVYSFGLIKPVEFHDILSIRRTEFFWAIVAFAGVVVLGTLKGIIVAIIISLLTLAYQIADPQSTSCGASLEPTYSGRNRRNIRRMRVFLVFYC
jgi:MFS superfamily sulfate permease-like transporter